MKIRLISIVYIQTAIILGLLLYGFFHGHEAMDFGNNEAKFDGLLSAKISEEIMEEKSFSIVNFAPLRTHLEEYIRRERINVSVYVENLKNGANIGVQERVGFSPASLNKLPLAILIMRKIEEGSLSLDTELIIQESDKLSTYGTLYLTERSTITVREALESMLKESDNTAFSVLLHYVSPQDVEFILDYYNLDIGLDFPNQALENHTNALSPKAMSTLFQSLYFSTVLEGKNSAYLLSLMEDTVYDIKTNAKLPEDARVAHKFGEVLTENLTYFHDCGILYFDGSKIFYCVMSRDLPTEKSIAADAYIVNSIYQYVQAKKEEFEAYQSKG